MIDVLSPLTTAAAWLLGACLLLLAYTYAGYPLLVRLLARFFPRPVKRGPYEPSVSFIIAAFNEEEAIAAKIENTLALDYPEEKLEIIVASDGSTDRTDDIVHSYADRGVRLFVPAAHRGKTATSIACAATATGDLLVFSDATGIYNREAVRALARSFTDPEVGLVSGRVVYDYDEGAAAQGFAAYQHYVVPQRQGEGRFGTETSVSGSIHAIRRTLFRPTPAHLSYDMVHPLHVAEDGYRTVYEAGATALEEARPRSIEEFRSRVRLAVRSYAFVPYLLARLGGVRHPWYRFQVISHKLLRWFSPLVLLIAALAAVVVALRGGWWLAPLGVLGLAGAVASLAWAAESRGLRIPGLTTLLFFAMINTAFLVGFVRHQGGVQVAGWAPDRGEGEQPTI